MVPTDYVSYVLTDVASHGTYWSAREGVSEICSETPFQRL